MASRIYSLIEHHDIPTVLLAILICGAGAVLFVQLLVRARRTEGFQRTIWTFYSGLVGGGTIWTTHCVAMLAWRRDILLGFEPVPMAISLLIAITITAAGCHILAKAGESRAVEVGGGVIGLGIAAMHYLGMTGLNLCASISMSPPVVILSILFATGFGVLAANRIARPITRFCRYGGALSFALAILLLHMTAIGALDVLVDWSRLGTVQPFEPGWMVAAILGVMSIVFLAAGGAYLNDTTQKEEANKRFRHLALHDSLTGLPNRTQVRDTLRQTLENAQNENSWVGVMSLDLDRFKEINDVYGHGAGDAVLRAVADRMHECSGDSAMIGRFGGDEFLAVVGPIWRKNAISDLSERIIEAVRKPIEWEGHALSVGISIGIARFPEDGRTADQLLDRADLAMYRAKANGKNRAERYETGTEETNRSRASLAMDLRRAIENNEFEIHYQLQNDGRTREIVGAEALLRWNHPERGRIPPSDFIPICEETGLIIEIGAMVLRRACHDAVKWSRPLRLAVNVAPRQILDGDLPKIVHEALLDSGLPADRLELEITESGILADQQLALHVIRQLKALGVRIAMDDYGTGYSSLSTLHNFPFDKIKIDRSFIADLPTNHHAAAIVRATIILANALKIPVLAEGVETEAHIDFLNDEGCQELQGFFFGQPMSMLRFCEVLDADGVAATSDAVEEAIVKAGVAKVA